MTTLTAHAIVEDGRLKIDLPTSLPPGNVEVEIRVNESPAKPRGTDIAAILACFGTIEIEGDPLEIQRKLRDEWSD